MSKRLLGIDYGKRKIGLAHSDGPLAEPLRVIKFINIKDALQKIKSVVESEKIETFVIGLSESEMAGETKKFAELLEKTCDIPVVFQDETLTTYEAQFQSIEAGIKRKKRKSMEDAYAAAIILQNYLDRVKS